MIADMEPDIQAILFQNAQHGKQTKQVN